MGCSLAADEERFEISSIKAVPPMLVDTIAALQQRDVVRAKPRLISSLATLWQNISLSGSFVTHDFSSLHQ
jgi:hypothetical protein